MQEILPGVFHWVTLHPRIEIPVSSYYLAEEHVLLDPLVPAEGLDWWSEPPKHVFLTNRHHYRDSGKFVERFGCTVWCVESGLHEFTKGQKVEPFRFGTDLPGNIRAVEIGVLCPDETALHIPRVAAVALADGVIREGDGPLTFVPDDLIGDDPDSIKAGLKDSYRRLADEFDFDHLLLAHGDPWVGGGKEALRAFAG
jgi:hypothetical protein